MYITLIKWVKILWTDGAKFGTFVIPRYSNCLKEFKVSLEDPSGAIVALDQKKLKKEYLASGKIIVPQVTAGCRIGVYVVYKNDLIEHGMTIGLRKNPCGNGKYTFHAQNQGRYAWKFYGDPRILKTGGNTRQRRNRRFPRPGHHAPQERTVPTVG